MDACNHQARIEVLQCVGNGTLPVGTRTWQIDDAKLKYTVRLEILLEIAPFKSFGAHKARCLIRRSFQKGCLRALVLNQSHKRLGVHPGLGSLMYKPAVSGKGGFLSLARWLGSEAAVSSFFFSARLRIPRNRGPLFEANSDPELPRTRGFNRPLCLKAYRPCSQKALRM